MTAEEKKKISLSMIYFERARYRNEENGFCKNADAILNH